MLLKKGAGHFDSVLLLSLSTAVFFGIIAYVERLLALKPPRGRLQSRRKGSVIEHYQRSLCDDRRHDYRAVAVAVHHSGSLQADVAAQASSPCGITCVARLRRQTAGGFSLRLSSERVDPFAVFAWCTTEFTDKRFVKRRFARITYRLGNHHHRQRFTRQGLGGDLQAQRC